jgi:hypothetical protein
MLVTTAWALEGREIAEMYPSGLIDITNSCCFFCCELASCGCAEKQAAGMAKDKLSSFDPTHYRIISRSC